LGGRSHAAGEARHRLVHGLEPLPLRHAQVHRVLPRRASAPRRDDLVAHSALRGEHGARPHAQGRGRAPGDRVRVMGDADAVRESLEKYVGKRMGPPSVAPDPVNVPMIRHWVDALDDRNPVYLDEAFAATTRFGGVVAPPAMLQAWSMARPVIAGIAERGG